MNSEQLYEHFVYIYVPWYTTTNRTIFASIPRTAVWPRSLGRDLRENEREMEWRKEMTEVRVTAEAECWKLDKYVGEIIGFFCFTSAYDYVF